MLVIFSINWSIFKDILVDGSLGQTKYPIRISWIARKGQPTCPLIHKDLNSPNIQNKDAYIEFIDKTINAQLPHHLNDRELFELVKTCQVHAHSRICWKYNNECRFSYGRYFTEKTIIAKSLDCKFSNDEKQEVPTWRNVLLREVKSYVDNTLNPAKVNLIDPTKDIFTQPLSIKKGLDESEISKDDYYRALSIRKQWSKLT